NGRRVVSRRTDRTPGVLADGPGCSRRAHTGAASRTRLSTCTCRSRTGDGDAAEMKRIVAILAPALLVWGCSRPAVEEVETKAAATVTTITLAPQTMEGIVAASGVVSAAPGADWTITAPEHGRIVDLPKAEGDRVKAGDL